MSQQGIFSIASDEQGGNSGQGQNGSPFSVSSEEPAQHSPFAREQEQQGPQDQSPFQRNQGDREQSSADRADIPRPRPEGQPSSFGSTATGSRMKADAGQATQQGSEQAPSQGGTSDTLTSNGPQAEAASGAFQINGFSQQTGNEVMEAAPVAAVSEASPFMAVDAERNDYEAAKANLEPQQDFAAVPSRFQPALEPAAAAPAQQQPQPAQQAAQPPQQQQVAAPAPVSAPALAPAPASPQLQQLELRAIFGVDHVLNTGEILQRARTLPGIRNVAIVGDREAEALSNFRLAVEGMGLGDSDQLKLSSGGGTVDFITEANSTLAVLLEGAYAPGVKETLIIVAREIGKLA